ncbi:MAG: lipopolysaccharide kinase InaA family protein [Candidatus Berkiella sp.]
MITCQWNKLVVCQPQFNTQRMQALLCDLDSAMQQPIKVLKDDPTSTVVILNIDTQPIVVKRANTKGYLHYLRRLFCTSRAKINWYFAHRLQSASIKTFNPIAYIEERFGPLKKRSYLICSLIKGIDALQFFSDPIYQASWEKVARNIVDMIQKLAAKKLSHRDLNLSNIILVDEEPYLIDLDSMRKYNRPQWAKTRLHEVKRFMENWQDYPAISPKVAEIFRHCFKEQGLLC